MGWAWCTTAHGKNFKPEIIDNFYLEITNNFNFSF